MPTVLPGAYHSPYDRMIAELMMRKGDIQARRAEQQGQIWGRAAENLGQIGAQYVQQRQEDKVKKQRQQLFDEAINTWDGKDPVALFKRTAAIIGPEAAANTMKAVAAFMQPHANEATFKDIVGGLYSAKKTLGEDYVAQHWPEYRAKLQQHSDAFNGGVQIEEQYRPEYGQMIDSFHEQLFTPPKETKPLSLQDQLAAATTPEEQQAILAKIRAAAEAGRAPEKTPAQIQAEAEARARGERIGNPPTGQDKTKEIEGYLIGLRNGDFGIERVPPSMVSEVVTAADKQGIDTRSTKQRDIDSAATALITSLDQLEDQAKKTMTSDTGPGAKVSGAIQRGASYIGLAEQTQLWDAQAAKLSMFARQLGERGTLTDQDVVRVQGLIPGLTDKTSVRDKKLKDIRDIIEAGLRGKVSKRVKFSSAAEDVPTSSHASTIDPEVKKRLDRWAGR